MRRLFWTGFGLAAALALGFLLVPLLAIFLRVPPGRLVGQLGERAVVDALVVSLETNAVAQGFVLLLGTPAAYLLASRRFPGRRLVVTLVELPLVLPPAVAGIGLLAAFGRAGLLGGGLSTFGVSLPFTQAAVVVAVAFVSGPFYVRTAVVAFEGVDRTLLDAARTLALGALLVAVSAALLIALKWTPSVSRSFSPFARSLSS